MSKAGNKLYETRRSFNLTPMACLSIDVTFEKVHMGARPERDMAVAVGVDVEGGGGSSPSLNRSHAAVRWQTSTVNRRKELQKLPSHTTLRIVNNVVDFHTLTLFGFKFLTDTVCITMKQWRIYIVNLNAPLLRPIFFILMKFSRQFGPINSFWV